MIVGVAAPPLLSVALAHPLCPLHYSIAEAFETALRHRSDLGTSVMQAVRIATCRSKLGLSSSSPSHFPPSSSHLPPSSSHLSFLRSKGETAPRLRHGSTQKLIDFCRFQKGFCNWFLAYTFIIRSGQYLATHASEQKMTISAPLPISQAPKPYPRLADCVAIALACDSNCNPATTNKPFSQDRKSDV